MIENCYWRLDIIQLKMTFDKKYNIGVIINWCINFTRKWIWKIHTWIWIEVSHSEWPITLYTIYNGIQNLCLFSGLLWRLCFPFGVCVLHVCPCFHLFRPLRPLLYQGIPHTQDKAEGEIYVSNISVLAQINLLGNIFHKLNPIGFRYL